MKTLFTAAKLCQSYGAVKALYLERLEVNQGELLLLTGRNGSGKSTLLRLLAFLEQPASGTLSYAGSRENPRGEITLLLQEPYLLKDTVWRNVTLGPRLRGDTAKLEERFDGAMRAVAFTRPEEMAHRMPGALSGGEKQRIALAARLIMRPKVLLLDEPTAHVDAASEQIILGSIGAALRDSEITVICATHDANLFQDLPHREFELAAPDA